MRVFHSPDHVRHFPKTFIARGQVIESPEKPERAEVLLKALAEKTGGKFTTKGVRDVRKALEDPTLDAISIATPNHWHSLMTIWAAQAGKHVYVEKPMSHDVAEGRVVVAAQRKYGVVIQHGTQRRSDAKVAGLHEAIQAGRFGKLKVSYGYCCKPRASIDFKSVGAAPSHLDWNLWQGPAQVQPFQINTGRKKPGLHVHYDWHYFWEYGNGEIGNQGVHQMDIACWGHHRGLPVRVHSAGGRFGMDDDGMTPNTQSTTFAYADGSIMTFQVRNLGSFQEMDGGDCGNSFFGTKGFYVVGKGFFTYKQGRMSERQAIPVPEGAVAEGDGNPFRSFIKACRSRKQEDAPMSVEDAHVSCAHCHLGNISHVLGKASAPDALRERIRGNAGLAEACGRMMEHLGANAVDLKGTPLTLGALLQVAPGTERFTGEFAAAANPLLTRQYRAPFTVPDLSGKA